MFTRGATLLFAAIVCVGLDGCASGFEATYDYDRSHNFGDHKTWAWISAHPMTVGQTDGVPSPFLEPRIMTAIENHLAAKGFDKVDDRESAEFAIAFTIGSREKIRVDTAPSAYGGYGYSRGWGGRYYGGMSYGTETRVREYTKGTLAIDIFDVDERAPRWHGVAEKSITSSDRENMEETIRAAVTAVLKNFPPGQP